MESSFDIGCGGTEHLHSLKWIFPSSESDTYHVASKLELF